MSVNVRVRVVGTLLALSACAWTANAATTLTQVKQELSLLKSIEALDFAVQKQVQQARVLQQRLDKLKASLSKVVARVTGLRHTIADQRGYFGRRLSAIRFLQSRGPVTLLVSSRTFGTYVRRQWLIRKLVEADQRRLATLQTNRSKLAATLDTMTKAQRRLSLARTDFVKKEKALKQLRDEKQSVWDKIKKSRWHYFRYREEMSLARKRLVHQLMRTRRRVIKRDWQDLRGRFLRPIWGRPIARFGSVMDRRFRTVTQNNGVLYRALRRQRVRAAYSGSVAFVGHVPGYSTVVIIDHANRLFTLSGHLSEAAVKKGDFITKGQTLGRAGTGPGGKSALYFEVREKGVPVDPAIYLRRRR